MGVKLTAGDFIRCRRLRFLSEDESEWIEIDADGYEADQESGKVFVVMLLEIEERDTAPRAREDRSYLLERLGWVRSKEGPSEDLPASELPKAGDPSVSIIRLVK